MQAMTRTAALANALPSKPRDILWETLVQRERNVGVEAHRRSRGLHVTLLPAGVADWITGKVQLVALPCCESRSSRVHGFTCPDPHGWYCGPVWVPKQVRHVVGAQHVAQGQLVPGCAVGWLLRWRRCHVQPPRHVRCVAAVSQGALPQHRRTHFARNNAHPPAPARFCFTKFRVLLEVEVGDEVWRAPKVRLP